LQKRIKKILIKAKREVFSEFVGNNPSIFKGSGFDFVELREYQYGDDIRKIDWIISAKLQKPYLKIFKEERELNVVVAFMFNGSIFFGSKRLKKDLAIEIGAILGFSTLKNQDIFNYFIFADRLYKSIKPTKNIHSINNMVLELDSFDPLGKVANFNILAKRLYKIKRKSLIFIIGDFLYEFDLNLLSKKHEVVAIIIRDRLEENPIEAGFINLIDPENKNSLVVDLDKASINRYKKEIKKRDYLMYKDFKKNRIRFLKIYTDEEPFVKLVKLFGRNYG